MAARFRMAGVASDSLIPTPPAGKATMFYNDADQAFKAKYSDGSVVILSIGTEAIHDIVGSFLVDSATINFTYNDVGDTMTATVIQSALDISQIPNVPSGNLTSPNVQAALNELQSDIDTRATHIFTTNILYVDKLGNDTTGDGTLEKPFATVPKALSVITANSASNTFLIKVGPGVFTGTIVSKPYVWVEGAEQDQTIFQPTVGDHVVIGADNSGISKCLLTGAVAAGKAAVYYASLTGTTNTSFFMKNVRFGSNLNLGIADASTAASAIFLEDCKFGSTYQFDHGFLGQNGGRVIARNCTTTGLTAPYPDYMFKATGSGSQIVLNACQLRSGGITTGACLHIADGAVLRASSVNVRMFGKAVWSENVGTGQIIDVNGILCEANTMDIQVDHPDTDGTLTGSADHTKVFVHPSSSFSPVFACNRLPSDGTGFVVIGDVLQGDRYDRFANLSLVARKATTLGVIEDEETPFIEFDTGLNVKVIAGTGFLNEPADKYLIQVNWAEQIIAIPANATKYVYVSHEGVVSLSDTPTNPETTLILGRVNSDASAIRFIENSDLPMNHYGNKTEKFLRTVLGPTFVSGCIVSENVTPFKLNVTAGSYYFGITNFQASGGNAIVWESFYRNGLGGWTSIASQDLVSNSLYDDGSGTLASIPAGKFVRHHLYIVGDGGHEKWFLVYGQQLFNSQSEAADGPIPIVPPFFVDAVTRVSGVIVEQGAVNITQFIDLRIRPGQAAPSGTSVTAHGDLTGLLNDDHTQYLLVNGTRIMAGNLNMGGNDITNVGTVNGVIVQTHASRHLPSGADPITTAAPLVAVGGNTSNEVGTANSFSRSDHQHDVATGVVSGQIPDQASAEGVSNNLARADHVHNIPTAAPATAIGANSTNQQGIAASFSRSDHEHDIVTAAPSTQTPDQANAEGVSNALARADHTHNIPADTAIGLDANSTSTEGAAAAFARSNHTHAIASGAASSQTPDQANAAGSSGNFARADHVHNIATAAAVTLDATSTNTQGGAASFARSNHTHAITTASAVSLTTSTTNTVGTAAGLARADHTHSVSIDNSQATATADTTTTSGTDVVMTGMTLTPGAGTYLVMFSGSVETSSDDADVFVNIYANGSIVAHTERQTSATSSFGNTANMCFPIATQTIVTVANGQAIDVRWRRSAGTATSHERTLTLVKLA